MNEEMRTNVSSADWQGMSQ